MASVHQHPKSRFWQAHFETWHADENHPDGGHFKRAAKSTGIPIDQPKRDALKVATQLEVTGRALAPDNASRHDRKFYTEMLNALFRSAGVEPQKIELTWREYSGTWLREKREEVTAHSYRKYDTNVRAFSDWLGVRSDEPMNGIKHNDVQSFYNEMMDTGRAARTVDAYIKVVSSILARAQVLGYVDNNPAQMIKRRKHAPRDYERQPFTDEEVTKILAWLRGSDDGEDWLTACLFGLYFGLRIQNACQRRVSEIEVKDDLPHRITFVPSKKQKAITLPIVGKLQTHLADLMTRRDDLLCPSLHDINHISQNFNAVVDAAGVKVEIVKPDGPKGNSLRTKSFHSWRHTNKSRMMNAGVEARVADLINNHDDPKVARQYTHIEQETMAKELARVLG